MSEIDDCLDYSENYIEQDDQDDFSDNDGSESNDPKASSLSFYYKLK